MNTKGGEDRGQKVYEGEWSNNKNKSYPVPKDGPYLKKTKVMVKKKKPQRKQ